MLKQKSILTATLWLVITLLCIPLALFAEETPLDESSPPLEVPTAPARYSGPPAISFSLSDEDYLLIKIDGLPLKDINGFTFAGTDISALIGQYEEQGIIKFLEKEDGFQMNVNLPIQQLAGKNEFGLLYGIGNKLSAVIDSEKLLADVNEESGDRGFGYTKVHGTLTKRIGCCRCGSCTQPASYARVEFYTYHGGWVYRGATTANVNGSFNVSLEGYDAPYLHVVVSSGGQSNSATFTGPPCACSNATVNASMYLQ